MARIVLSEFLTLDGVMQAPGGEDEDRSGGFEHGGWQALYADADVGRAVGRSMATTDALLLGRRTYDIFAAYWPATTDWPEGAEQLNRMPKYVVSTTLEEPLQWNNSTLIKENVPNELGKLKELPGRDILVFGSGGLAQTLMEHDLIDEYRLMVYPLVLGSGRRLFRDGNPKAGLRLVDSAISSTGTLIVTYAPERPK
jgi:dihydrofolate reductase